MARGDRRRFCKAGLILGLAVFLQPGCTVAPVQPATPTRVPTPGPLPTDDTRLPPRPTAAPPALSPLSSPIASPNAAGRRLPRLRTGQVGALNDSGVLIALNRGFFADQGLDVQLVSFTSANAMQAALGAGQLDVASLPITAELFNLLASGTDFKIVAETAGAPPGNGAAGLVVRPDLAYSLRTPTDLRGFRVALPARGDSLEVELGYLLKQGWLARTDVETILLSPAEISAWLADGSLDGAMIFEPYLSELERTGIGRVWRRSDRILPDHLTAALVFTPQFSAAQPDSARRYVTAFLKAARLYNDAFVKHRSARVRGQLINMLSRLTNVSELASSDQIVLPGMNPNGMVNVQTLRLDQQYFLASGQQRKEVDLAAFVDAQYAAYAITQLGEYRR